MNITLSLEEYGIKANSNYTFYGENIVIFYQFEFGLYPYFKDYNKSAPVNGGMPQDCNLGAHLKKVRKDITNIIPDENFTNHAIIDFEHWRPLFEELYDTKKVYQEASIERVKRNDPSLSDAEARQQAVIEFDNAAKTFLVETIKTARQMRPKAFWSFYGFPYCNYNAGQRDSDYSCSRKFESYNDKMQYIFEESTALSPSIYLESKASAEQHFRYVQAVLMEALRIANKCKPPLPVYPYSKFEYDLTQDLHSFYDSSDRCSTIKQPANLGVDGLVFWSSSANMAQRCESIKDYVKNHLGPITLHVIEQQQRCEKVKHCSVTQKCMLKKSDKIPPYPYSTICASSKSNSTDYDDYECIP